MFPINRFIRLDKGAYTETPCRVLGIEPYGKAHWDYDPLFVEIEAPAIARQHNLHVNTRKAIRRDTIESERQFAACAC